MAVLSTRRAQVLATLLSVTLTIVLLSFWHAGGTLSAAGAQLTVSVVTEPGPYPLTYRWRSSDGQISNVNSPTTSWTLSDGPGLHFAYVLISDGHGGYTEQRVAVNTDGTPTPTYAPRSIQPPTSPYPTDLTYRRWSVQPDVLFYALSDSHLSRVPATGVLKADVKQQMTFRGMSADGISIVPDDFYSIYCSFSSNGPFEPCSDPIYPEDLPADIAISEPHFQVFPHPFGARDATTFQDVKVTLEDGSPCGTTNEFFGVEATAKVEVRDGADALVAGPFRVSSYGFYEIFFPPGVSNPKMVIRCENAPPLSVPFTPGSVDLLTSTIPSTGRPVVSTMTASLGAQVVGQFTKPVNPVSLPSDNVPEFDKFLAFKGLDSRLSGCLYYKAIGAVTGCDRAGNLIGAIHFDDWKRTVQIGPHANGATEYSATYINKMDLNLTRNHHSISVRL